MERLVLATLTSTARRVKPKIGRRREGSLACVDAIFVLLFLLRMQTLLEIILLSGC